MAQYSDCVAKLHRCSTPNRLFEDVRGMFASVGWLLPHTSYLVLRLVVAFGVLGLGWYVRRYVREPFASFFIAAFAANYLMLFNPRTLSTSYVMTVSYAALLTACHAMQRRRRATLGMCAVVLGWTVSYRTSGLGFIQHWLRPLDCVVFCAALLQQVAAQTSRVTVSSVVSGAPAR
jgi:hypothetical protein